MNFDLKLVRFFNRDIVIICQNENGPCPLLALANALILQNIIEIHNDRRYISLDELIEIVANRYLELCQRNHSTSSTTSAMRQQQLDEILTVLPSLVRGLDLNVRFSGVSDFEFTKELSVFDALDINLFHGWIVDREDVSTKAVLEPLTYNHATNKLIEYRSLKEILASRSDAALSEEMSTLLIHGELIELFLRDCSSQLTYSGLEDLHQIMRERQVAVLFRNNHFSTIFKFGGNLFSLVTDQGFFDEKRAVWESLNAIDGCTDFFNSEFMLVQTASDSSRPLSEQVFAANGRSLTMIAPAGISTTSVNDKLLGDASFQSPTINAAGPLVQSRGDDNGLDADFLYALQLQDEEEDRIAWERTRQKPFTSVIETPSTSASSQILAPDRSATAPAPSREIETTPSTLGSSFQLLEEENADPPPQKKEEKSWCPLS